MTTVPNTIWDPLGKQTEPRMSAHDILCFHTMGGAFDVVRAMFKQNGYGGTESHLGIAGSGKTAQWQDLDFTADANLNGNWHVVSIETADRGENFPKWTSRVPPWTPEQMSKLIQHGTWICKHYEIPPIIIPDSKPGRRGLAYHRQGINGNFNPPTYKYPGRVTGGELWSSAFGKLCPDDARIRQLHEVVQPGIARNLLPVDWDFVAIATKGDRRRREKFERTSNRYHEWIDRHVERGWSITTRRVRG